MERLTGMLMIQKITNSQNGFLILRPMQPEDTDILSHIYLDTRVANFFWLESPALSDFSADSSGELVQVAVIDGEIVGFASLSTWDSFLHLLFVKDNFQKKGIGAALLKWARQTAKKPLELKVVTYNTRARHFYEREGFKNIAHSNTNNPANVTYRDDRNSQKI